MATKTKNFTEIIEMIDAVKRGEDMAEGDLINEIGRLNGIISSYETYLKPMIETYNLNSKPYSNGN